MTDAKAKPKAEVVSKSLDVGEAEVQAKQDVIDKQGYSGVVPDENPNSTYTAPTKGSE